jgi:hypothetical protein
MTRSPAWDAWVEKARAVPLEDEIARRGINLRRQGKELVGPCPQCGGDDRFAINTTKQVFNCRGCGGKGDVIALVEFLDGIDFTHAVEKLTGEPTPKPNGKYQDHRAKTKRDIPPSAKPVLVESYPYHDEDGEIVVVVDRYEYQIPNGSFFIKHGKRHKTFKQRRPDPDRPGAWIEDADGVPVVPYRLIELIEAVANDHPIIVVEGERKVDLLAGWNVPATCCRGGSKNWKPENASFLAGAGVIILPDNDERGRQYLEAVAASLQGFASSVQVLNLPDLPPTGDIVDWAAAGGTVEQLHDLIAHEAKPWTPGETTTADTGADDAGAEPPRERWTVPLMTWRDPATIPQRQFLYGHYYARGTLSATVADGGMGKSILRLAELLAMITGRDLLGITPRERVRCLYWNGDDPYVEIERRIHAVAQHYGIDLKKLLDEGWLTIGTSDAQPLCIASIKRGGGLDLNTSAIDDICALIRERKIGLACFDPFKSLHRVPENDNTLMDAVADALKVIAVDTDAAIAVDHHIRKPALGQAQATTADARGAIALINKARLSRVCNPMTPQQALGARIKEDERGYFFRVDLGKANIAPPEKAVWFKRVPILCANGEYTPVVLPWKYPGPFDTVTNDHMHRVREMARNGPYRSSAQASDWIGRAVAEVLGLDVENEADKKQIKTILKTWFANGVLDTEEREDAHRHHKTFVVPGNWNEADNQAAADADK